MSFTISTPNKLSDADIESAARLAAAGFGRPADEHNLADTTAHLSGVDYVYLAHDVEGGLAGFALYRRLWRGCI